MSARKLTRAESDARWTARAIAGKATRDARERLAAAETPARARPPALVPMDAQLDTDGRLHEIDGRHERARLFKPAPTQLAGQTSFELDEHGAGTKEGNDETL